MDGTYIEINSWNVSKELHELDLTIKDPAIADLISEFMHKKAQRELEHLNYEAVKTICSQIITLRKCAGEAF